MERKRREHEQLWREDSRGTLDPQQLEAERVICPTWEDVVLEREQFFAEHPDFIEPLNETWFFEIRRGNVSTINQLVLQGAKVEWVDEYGDRAIHLAAAVAFSWRQQVWIVRCQQVQAIVVWDEAQRLRQQRPDDLVPHCFHDVAVIRQVRHGQPGSGHLSQLFDARRPAP